MCSTSNDKVHEFCVSRGGDQKLVVHMSIHTTHQEVLQHSTPTQVQEFDRAISCFDRLASMTTPSI